MRCVPYHDPSVTITVGDGRCHPWAARTLAIFVCLCQANILGSLFCSVSLQNLRFRRLALSWKYPWYTALVYCSYLFFGFSSAMTQTGIPTPPPFNSRAHLEHVVILPARRIASTEIPFTVSTVVAAAATLRYMQFLYREALKTATSTSSDSCRKPMGLTSLRSRHHRPPYHFFSV